MTCFYAGHAGQVILILLTGSLLSYIQDVLAEEWNTDVYAHRNWKKNVKRVQPHLGKDCSCKSGQISCLVECTCVLTSQVCDGVLDCPSGHDETNCAKQLCQGRFACRSGVCIHHELTCDGVDDCGDGSDELMCRGRLPMTLYNCSEPHVFNCTDGEYCIPVSWKCDGNADCYDQSDENNCIFNKTCQPNEFKCRTGRCIGLPYVCDGATDCEDASDEINCSLESPKRKCNETEFSCMTPGRCVALHYQCDGEDDCGDWSDERECNTTSCTSGNFRCNSGRCIEKGWVCDGSPDCDDGEDEKSCPNPLSKEDCHKDTFWCPNVCISSEWRCDGEYDCIGGEDEIDCDQAFTCDKDMFTCGTGRYCISKNKVCDGHQDCLDGIDETDCDKSDCTSLSCSYGCHKRPNGKERCICEKGLTLSTDNITCVDVDECLQFNPCSQLCENKEGEFQCNCVSGYNLRPDMITCKAQPPPARLIFATRDDVREINLSGQEYPPIALNLENAIAVDFHYRREFIYWTDVTIDAILRAYRNGSGKAEIIRWGLQQPCGLSVDWYNDHIYWVDSITRRVEVADLDGSNRRPLIWTDLQKPRSIVVHPKRSLIIWTDWGKNARIEKAYMDGSGRTVLIGDHLFWPNGITIDYTTETLYWVDAKQHVIEAAHVDGTKRRKVSSHRIPHPFGITVFEDRLYWSDWKMRSIRSVNKRTGGDPTVVHSNVAFPMGIKSMHPQRQPLLGMGQRSGCSWNNGGCSHLCLPSSRTYSCFCPHGLFLLADSRTCSSQPDLLLLFAQRNNLRMISLQEELEDAENPTFVDKSNFKISADEKYEAERPRMDNVVPVDSVQTSMALDFDEAEDMIYWTDIAAHSISRAHLNGSGQQILVSNNLEIPCGLAVDWINHKLYWTDDGTNRIEVSNLDGTNRAILIWEKLHRPRDIVVNPKEGHLFWAEWGSNASISRASMDGSDRVVIAHTNLKWPNGLAVDYEINKLFWLDASFKMIESADFDGKNRKKVFGDDLHHPFGLAIYKKYIFWSDWETNSIYLADKKTGFGRQQLVRGLKDLMDIRVFHRRERDKKFENPCSLRNGGCSHLCLLKPNRGYTCACPTGILLQKGGRKCHSTPSEWLVYAHRTAVRTLSLDTPYLADVILHLPTLHNVVAIDVDSVSGDLFLPDSAAACILRCSMDGLRCTGVVASTITTVEGIAIEPTTRKMYWTDFDRQSIEVSDLNGLNRRVLFINLDKPRAITTHYPSGRFYWTDWADDHPRIEVADLDGQDRRIFVSDDISWPNGLSVDWTTNELFWTDAKLNKIFAIRLDGEDRRTVVSGADVTHPYGITVLGDWVYWTDWLSKSLLRAKKNSGNRITRLISGYPGLMDVKGLPGPTLSENVCKSNNSGCSHICLRNPQGFSCACPTGLLLKDGRQCENLPSKYLVVATKGLLRRISLDTTPLWDVDIDVPGVLHPVSVDVHLENQQLFYVDSDLESFRVFPLQNSTYPEVIPTQAFTSPDGLAVDWIADNLYWTDAANSVIEVAHIGTYGQKVIVRTDLHEPRAIAVFPEKGLLFWTDWGNHSKIERSLLDGSERNVILSSGIGWPNGLVLDTKNSKIYWTDAQKDTIETADLDGMNRAVLLEKLQHPFGVALLGDYIYWTDWETKSVERAERKSGLHREIVVKGLEEPMEIVAVDNSLQTGWNPCAERNGGCTHLCLFKATKEVVCACPDADTPKCSERPFAIIPGGENDLWNQASTSNKLSKNFIIVVAIIGALVGIVVGVVIGGMVWLKCRRAQKYTESAQSSGGELTFTNPTYAPSQSDITTERKPFSWRLHHDNPQVGHFDEKGEVTALISEGSSVEHDSPPVTPNNDRT